MPLEVARTFLAGCAHSYLAGPLLHAFFDLTQGWIGELGLLFSFSYQISATSSSEPICIRLEGSSLQMTMVFQIHLQEWCFQLIAKPPG